MKKTLLILLSFSALFAFGQTATTKLLDDFESGDKGWAPVDQGWVDFQIVPNPAPDAVNSSANVLKITRHPASQTYAGVILRNYMTLTFGTLPNQYRFGKVKFYKPAAGDVTFKLENGGDAGSCSASASYTTASAWQEVTFDLGYASGGTAYHDFFIMPAKDATLTADVTVYIDDIKFETDPNAVVPDTSGQTGNYEYKLVWSDEFNGNSLNTNNWNIEVNNSGMGNGELEYYTDRPQNVSVGVDPATGDNCLILTAIKEEYGTGSNLRHCTSGRINSKGKYSFQYGKIEARMKIPYTANGLWPAFWMMGNTGGWPACGEIDIMEMGQAGAISAGTQDRYFSGWCHWGTSWNMYGPGSYPNTGKSKTNSYPVQGSYHIFTMEWDDTHLSMYLDHDSLPDVPAYNTLTYSPPTGTADPAAAAYTYFTAQPFYILLNLAVGGTNGFTGCSTIDKITAFNAANNNQSSFYIDYVRVYQKVPVAVKNVQTSSISVFPNPTNNTVKIAGLTKAATVTVTDLTGKTVLTAVTNGNLDISPLGNGMYLLNVENQTFKIVKK